jgi:hypothetical protein
LFVCFTYLFVCSIYLFISLIVLGVFYFGLGIFWQQQKKDYGVKMFVAPEFTAPLKHSPNCVQGCTHRIRHLTVRVLEHRSFPNPRSKGDNLE